MHGCRDFNGLCALGVASDSQINKVQKYVLRSGQNNVRTDLGLRCRRRGGVIKSELTQVLPFSTVTSCHLGCFQRQKTACYFKATFSLRNVLILFGFSFQVTRIWRCTAPKSGEFHCMIHALLRSVVLSVFSLSQSEPTDIFCGHISSTFWNSPLFQTAVEIVMPRNTDQKHH